MKKIFWRIINFLMLSCKRSSELMEKKLHFGLTPLESFQLKLHTSMCSACSAYQKQSHDLHKTLHKYVYDKEELGGTSVNDTKNLQDRIIKKIKQS